MQLFSLLRGSGLKYKHRRNIWHYYCSPSYEGVDWNSTKKEVLLTLTVLPLTREWIEIAGSRLVLRLWGGSPSYEGVDWNALVVVVKGICGVLPLTREWIEILSQSGSLPFLSFSLLRGSGLKCKEYALTDNFKDVLPLTREWIEMGGSKQSIKPEAFSLLRGSGLKSGKPFKKQKDYGFSLLRGSGLKYHYRAGRQGRR